MLMKKSKTVVQHLASYKLLPPTSSYKEELLPPTFSYKEEVHSASQLLGLWCFLLGLY